MGKDQEKAKQWKFTIRDALLITAGIGSSLGLAVRFPNLFLLSVLLLGITVGAACGRLHRGRVCFKDVYFGGLAALGSLFFLVVVVVVILRLI